MSQWRERESPPIRGSDGQALGISKATTSASHTVPPHSDIQADRDAMAKALRGRFVVQVQVDIDMYGTHVYISVISAENAVRRANARCKRSHVSLCQLLATGVVVGVGGVA